MPGRHTAASAPVSYPSHTPRPTPPLSPLGRRPWTPERPEAEAPVSSVPPSTASPPWTGVLVVHGLVDSVHGFPLGKQFPENLILDILHLGPSVFPKSTRSPKIYSQTQKFENNYKKVPSLRKIHKNSSKTSKIYIFSTTTEFGLPSASLHVISFLILASSHHKSTQLAYIVD
jgi:hypothetical protein